MKLIRALIPLGLLFLPVFVRAADSFEGTVTMSISDTANHKGMPPAMTYSVKGENMRIDMKTDRGTVGMIMDMKTRSMIMLMAQQKMYMVNPFPAPDAATAQAKAAADHVAIKDTGVRETIMGYSCQKWEVTSDSATTDMWLAPDLTGFSNMYASSSMGSSFQIPGPLLAMIKSGGGFPMKMVTALKSGNTVTMVVTDLNRQKLSDSLFVPPSDYRKFDMQQMINAARGGSGG